MYTKKFSHQSASTKMQQAYWEAKRNIRISLGNRDDDCMIANDSELDTKIEFLQAADCAFDTLMAVLLKYNQVVSNLMVAEENLGNALIEYSIRDTTKAGEMMSVSGKAITRGANRRAPLKNQAMKLYHEVQTFQFKATVDAFLAVAKMEKVRKSYRSGLMWMKNESQNLDPEVSKKMKKFRKIQEHIKNLKIRFDRTKLEVMQKIDLYLLSRCNLFSQTLVEYQKVFSRMTKNYAVLSKEASKKTALCFSFKFQTLQELNSYSTMSQICLMCHMNSKLMSENASEGDGNRLMSISKCDHFKSKQKPNIPLSESGSKPTLNKLDRIKVPLVSNPTRKVPEQEEMLLVNLNDDESVNHFDALANTVSQSDRPGGNYSTDLLSLSYSDCQAGDISTLTSGSGDFKHECEKSFDFFYSITPPAEPDCNGLQFWSLMEDYKKHNYSPINFTSTEATVSEDTKSKQNAVSSNSHWEDILIEFDPFSDNNGSSKKINDETC